MKEDLWRLLGVFSLSLLLGLITGQVAVCLVTGLLLLGLWQYQALQQLFHWLQRRKENNPPEMPGIIDDIICEIDFLRRRHRRRKAKLSGFLKRFRDATAALPDATLVLGEFGEIRGANSKAIDYLGIRWPQDKKQRVPNLIRHPDLISFLNDEKKLVSGKALQLVSPVNAGQTLEIRLVPYGRKQKLLVARDITKIHRIDQMRKDFIANASHELRTPLTVIAGYLEGFDGDSELCPQEWKLQIGQMRRQTGRMQRLIEDLLMLSALETEVKHTEADMVAVPELLAAIHQEAQALSGAMEHIFYLETEPDLLIKGNQRELGSAFSNLVFNAVQHTPERGVIRIRWYRDAEGVHLAVTDTGTGISPEHLPRLTERFYRVDKGRSRDQGGTGLGR